MYASENNHKGIVQLLLAQSGIEINCQNILNTKTFHDISMFFLNIISFVTFFLEFHLIKVYKTAIDIANDNGYSDIAAILSKGPTKTTEKSISPEIEALNSLIKQLENENSALKSEITELQKSKSEIPAVAKGESGSFDVQQLNDEIAKLKSFLLAFKEKPTKIESVDYKHYQEGRLLGHGAQSSVKEISTIERFAKKELIQFDYKSLQRFLHESEVLVQLRHPCIVRIHGFDYGDDSSPPSILLSLEPSSLEQSIQNHSLTNEEKNRIAVEIVLGMRYMHSHNLIHRDMKPANILLSKNKHVRIADFGLTKEENFETSQSKGIGTILFMAPELYNYDDDDDTGDKLYGCKVDVYSFGITLLFLITEQYPKYNLSQLVSGKPPKLIEKVVGWAAELITQCLQALPDDRPSFSEIFETFKLHNFDLFSDTNPMSLSRQQRKAKEDIEHRILKIEAYEYQQQLNH